MLSLTVCASGAQLTQTHVQKNPSTCECSVISPPVVPDLRGTQQAPLVVSATLAKSSDDIHKEDQDRVERRASDWRTLILGIATAIILALQLWVFGQQARRLHQSIDEMKIATEATKTAAHAAETTVETMKATARRQLRAYVAIKDPLISRVDQQGQPEATITIRNYGQTPAYQFSVSTEMALVSSFEQACAVPDRRGLLGHLGPGADFTVRLTALFTISNAQFAQLATEVVSIFVYGIIRYVDTFGEPHFTRFRLQMGKDRRLFTCVDGNATDDDLSNGNDNLGAVAHSDA